MRDYMSVARTILAQLNTNKREVWAWGSNNFIGLQREMKGKKYPSLMFSIRTPKVKKGGRVAVSLDYGTDTYIVEAFTVRNNTEKRIGIKEDVHCVELHDVINSLIEDEATYYSL